MATRNQNRKPEPKPDNTGSTKPAPIDADAVGVEKPEPTPEKPDYAALEAMAGEDAANGEDYTPEPGDKPEAGALGAKELQRLYQAGFALASVRLGQHWLLTAEESRELAKATDAVLEKYGAKKALGPELTLALTAGMVTVPRLIVTMNSPAPQLETGGKPDGEGEKTEPGRGGEAGDGGQ